MQRLQKIIEQLKATKLLLETIMGLTEDVNALLDRVDTATTAIAGRFQKLIDEVQPGLITKEQADSLKLRMGAEVTALEKLGAAGVESIPLEGSSPSTGQ